MTEASACGCCADTVRGRLREERLGGPLQRPVCTNDQGKLKAGTTRVPRRYTVIPGSFAVRYALHETHNDRPRGRGATVGVYLVS